VEQNCRAEGRRSQATVRENNPGGFPGICDQGSVMQLQFWSGRCRYLERTSRGFPQKQQHNHLVPESGGKKPLSILFRGCYSELISLVYFCAAKQSIKLGSPVRPCG
jgi:hypothetical protein